MCSYKRIEKQLHAQRRREQEAAEKVAILESKVHHFAVAANIDVKFNMLLFYDPFYFDIFFSHKRIEKQLHAQEQREQKEAAEKVAIFRNK